MGSANAVRLGIAAAVALLGSATGIEAAELIFFDEDGGGGNPRGLYNYDTDTGVATLRAPVTADGRFFAMDTRLSDMTVFAADLDGGLWTIDIDTGTPSFIGATGIDVFLSLAIHPTTDELFGLRNNVGLYSIDPSTAVATFLGPTASVHRGLAFSPAGDLFGFTPAGDLWSVNPLNGQVIPVGGTGNPVVGVSEDATFTRSGELFATDYLGTIFQTDPLTGDGVAIGTTGMDAGLLALIEVPEPATIVLVGSALGLLLLRRSRIRRVSD